LDEHNVWECISKKKKKKIMVGKAEKFMFSLFKPYKVVHLNLKKKKKSRLIVKENRNFIKYLTAFSFAFDKNACSSSLCSYFMCIFICI
jgi:DNA topoisomerase VI subunit A